MKKMYLVGYEVWGNEETGYDVNNIYRYYDCTIDIPDDIDNEELVKLVKSWDALNPKKLENLSIFNWDEWFIEFENENTGESLFRLEEVGCNY